MKIVLNILGENELLDKLYFIATDGAQVVKSEQNGLVGKLTQKIPHL